MRNDVEIEFGGKTRHLIFDFNAKAEIQAATADDDGALVGLKALRLLLWAGLLAETLVVRGGRLRPTKNTLSEYDVGEILDGMSKPEIDAITEQMRAAQAVSDPEPDNRPTQGEPQPLTSCGPSPELTSDSPISSSSV